jgi:hypothetical protein
LYSTTTPTYTLAEGNVVFLGIFTPFAYSNIGSPQQNPAASYSINKPNGGGLLFLQDTQLIETLAHFARERIPERFVRDFSPCFYLPVLIISSQGGSC